MTYCTGRMVEDRGLPMMPFRPQYVTLHAPGEPPDNAGDYGRNHSKKEETVSEVTTKELQLVECAEEEASPTVSKALRIHVTDEVSMEAAGSMLSQLKKAKSTVVEIFRDPKAKALAAHRSVVAAEKTVLEPILAADKHLRSEADRYDLELERKQKAFEEQQRKAAEAAAQREQERQMNEALAKGDVEEAEQIVETPPEAFVPQPIPISRPKLSSNVGVTKKWKGELKDLGSLVRAVARGEAPISFLAVDQRAIDAYAKETEGKTPVAGIRWYQSRHTTAR